MPDEIVGAIPVAENVVRTHVEVRQILGYPQQRLVGESVAEQVNRLAVVVVHPPAGSGRRVRFGAQIDAAYGLRQRAVEYEERLAVLDGYPRAWCAESRYRRFARHGKPVGVDIMIDGEETGHVVRDFGPQLLGGPYRPLSGS